jgi:phosphoglucosamine mutase
MTQSQSLPSMTQNKRQYFGTDGIRGAVGMHPITPDFALKLGHAVGQVLKRQYQTPLVLIGKDTRISGYMLESAIESGLISAGVDVLLLGPIPTPAVAYLTYTQSAALGIVISASHNHFHDNGIKFFGSQGNKLSENWEAEVEKALTETPKWCHAKALGRAKRLNDVAGRYIEFCKSTFDKRFNLKGLKIVIDAAHGAAYSVAPDILRELGAQVIRIGCDPDGFNINDKVGATYPNTIANKVKETQADLGIALDGDADRLHIVDHNGRHFNGDALLYIIVQDRLIQGETVAGVVGTLMTNMGIERALTQQGIQVVRTQVGDRYILESLEQHGWILGGESSGHIITLDKQSTGDGLVNAMQVLQAMVRSQKTIGQLLDTLTLFSQTMTNVKIPYPRRWEENKELVTYKNKIEAELGQMGRVLIRPSGTEPVLRIMVEASDSRLSQQYAQQLANIASTI